MAQSKVNVHFKSVTFAHLAFDLNLCTASFLESQSHISIPICPSLEATSDIQALKHTSLIVATRPNTSLVALSFARYVVIINANNNIRGIVKCGNLAPINWNQEWRIS